MVIVRFKPVNARGMEKEAMVLYREYFTGTPLTRSIGYHSGGCHCYAPASFPIVGIILNYYTAYGWLLLLEDVVGRPRNTVAPSTQESVKSCFGKFENRYAHQPLLL